MIKDRCTFRSNNRKCVKLNIFTVNTMERFHRDVSISLKLTESALSSRALSFHYQENFLFSK